MVNELGAFDVGDLLFVELKLAVMGSSELSNDSTDECVELVTVTSLVIVSVVSRVDMTSVLRLGVIVSVLSDFHVVVDEDA